MDLSPGDLDVITRTVLGEAGANASPDEQAAIASVILNRMKLGSDGGYGDTVSDVVHQRNAFQAWTNPRAPNYPGKYNPQSAAYRGTAAIVNSVANGSMPDPTGGMTHYLQPDMTANYVQSGVAKGWPEWAKGEGKRIGQQVFYPEPVTDASALKFLQSRWAQEPQNTSGMTDQDAHDYLQQRWATQPTQTPAPAKAAVAPPGSVPTPPQVGTGRTWETQEEAAAEAQRGAKAGTLTENLQNLREAINPTVAGPDQPLSWQSFEPRFVPGAIENVKSGVSDAASAVQDWWQGKSNLLPNFEVTQRPAGAGEPLAQPGSPVYGLQMKEPGAVLRAFGGAAETTQIPAVLGGVQDLVTKATGNPEAGRTAADILSLITVPEMKGIISPAARGENAATRAILHDIGPQNAAQVAQELRSNPTLAAVDKAPAVLTTVQRIAAKSTDPELQRQLDNFVSERVGGAKAVAKAALDATGNAPEVEDALARIQARVTAAGKEKIDPIVQNAGPADITGVIKSIDDQIASNPIGAAALRAWKAGKDYTGPSLSPYQNRLLDLRQQLRGSWQDQPQMFMDVGGEQGLHQIQSGLRQEAEDLMRSPSTRRDAGRLMDLRNQIVSTIDNENPGYAGALSSYREANDVQRAYERGFNFASQPKGLKGQQDQIDWNGWAKDATPDEMEAARWGALHSMRQAIGQIRTAGLSRDFTKIPDVEFTADRLRQLFGDDRADQLMSVIQDEQQKAYANRDILGGSQTAKRSQPDLRFEPGPAKAFDIKSLLPGGMGAYAGYLLDPIISHATGAPLSGPAVGYAVAQGIGGLLRETRKASNAVAAREYVRMATDPQARGELIDLLERQAGVSAGVPTYGSTSISRPKKLGDLLTRPLGTALTRQIPPPMHSESNVGANAAQ